MKKTIVFILKIIVSPFIFVFSTFMAVIAWIVNFFRINIQFDWLILSDFFCNDKSNWMKDLNDIESEEI